MVARLRMRKRARGGLSPVIEPYSRDTSDVRRHRPSRMSMYLGRGNVYFKPNPILVYCLGKPPQKKEYFFFFQTTYKGGRKGGLMPT